jgi:hypothetical protein
MTITAAIKGQLTKSINKIDAEFRDMPSFRFNAVRQVFARHMPSEQAKHAARSHLATR